MKRITPDQHLALTFTPFASINGVGTKKQTRHELPRFAKPGEPQDKAMRRVLLRGAMKPVPNKAFPKWIPGMSTSQYLYAYQANRQKEMLPIDISKYHRPRGRVRVPRGGDIRR